VGGVNVGALVGEVVVRVGLLVGDKVAPVSVGAIDGA
jgi:hypothetical protein